MDVPGYEELREVLERAYNQSARGKGVNRHGKGKSFKEQPIIRNAEKFGMGGPLYQASKKIEESTGLEGVDAQVHELLGAIIYVAGAIVYLESKDAVQED